MRQHYLQKRAKGIVGYPKKSGEVIVPTLIMIIIELSIIFEIPKFEATFKVR
jgi:hypothetical protein